jgi:hypothetical protein
VRAAFRRSFAQCKPSIHPLRSVPSPELSHDVDPVGLGLQVGRL